MKTNDRFRFTEGLDYRLHFANYYHDGWQIDDGSYNEMRNRAAKRLRSSRKQHEVVSLVKGWEWEIQDDGEGLVDPRCGVMSIQCVEPNFPDEDFFDPDDDDTQLED